MKSKTMKIRGKFLFAAICWILFLALILVVRTVDVGAAGNAGGTVGLSHLNQSVLGLFGENMLWYDITGTLGIVAIVTMFLFAALGAFQMIKRRSLLKVDRELIALGVLYAVVVILYVFFEVIIVNYRPIIMPGGDGPEASFPSSHTMLVCVVMGSAVILFGKYIMNKYLRTALCAVCCIIAAITVVGRLVSGVHWFTDIAGGLLVSAALITGFWGAIDMIEEKNQN